MKRFSVIGENINYSLSPLIHNKIFNKLNIDANYNILNISSIYREIAKLRQLSGFNVTIPYKETIINYCDYIDNDAKDIKAINCVKIVNNKLYGYNTDVYGFFMLLKENNVNINSNTNVLIIGAGGAAKAVNYCLRKHFDSKITITNRTINNTKRITNNILDFSEIDEYIELFDIVINCTSVGVKKYDSPINVSKIKERSLFIDVNYQRNLKFLNDAKSLGAHTINGYDMLLYQAKKSFEIWFLKYLNINFIKDMIGEI